MAKKNKAISNFRYFRATLPSVFLFLYLLACCHFAHAQSDSTLSPAQFYEMVVRFHPLVKQASLFEEIANRELQISRGDFDPKAEIKLNRKSFEGKDYFNLFNPELKIPTWPGVDLKTGLERNLGTNISSERETPPTGLQYLGLSVPLGQGLWTDARRTAVKQAKIGIQLADAQRLSEVNKILFSAAKSYWDWYFNYQEYQLAQTAIRLANERYRAVKQRVVAGDQAPIDSVEARIFQQDRALLLFQSRLDEQNSRLVLSSYIWSENETPFDILPGAKPKFSVAALTTISDSAMAQLQTQAQTSHPELRKLNFKIDQLNLERRLGIEQLKPQFNLNYTWLSRTDSSIWASQSIDRNYKFGFDFGIPLFLRKERGKLGLVKAKILQSKLDLIQSQRNVQIGIATNFNELKNLETMIRLQDQMVANYLQLRDGELKKFDNGESSLFLINSREMKLIEAQIKSAQLISKYQQEKAAVYYAAGRNPLVP